MAAIVGMDDDAHGVDRRMLRQRPHSVPQYRHSAERQILLREWPAEPRTTSGGDDQGDAGGHSAS